MQFEQRGSMRSLSSVSMSTVANFSVANAIDMQSDIAFLDILDQT